MPSRPPTEERSEGFRNRFSQTPDAGSSEPSSAEPFISEDDESSAETVIPPVSIENRKARCMALDRETDRLNKLSNQRDDEIKELGFKLKKPLLLVSPTLSVLDLRKYLILPGLLTKRILLGKTGTAKFRIN